jgi:hypothetical protein
MGKWIASQDQQAVFEQQPVELSWIARLKRGEKMAEVGMVQLPLVREARQDGRVAQTTESNFVTVNL